MQQYYSDNDPYAYDPYAQPVPPRPAVPKPPVVNPRDPNQPPRVPAPAPTPPVEDGPPEVPHPAMSGWDTAPANGDWRGWFLQNVSGMPANPGSLTSIEGQLGKHGISVLRNASGIAGKIRLPTGEVWDVGRAFSSGNPSAMGWQWVGGDGGASSTGAPDFSGMGIDPSYLAPFTGKAPERGRSPVFHDPGSFQADAFVAPTAETIAQDPSFQFRMDEGRGVLENSAAARGTLNSGGTLHDILNYGQKAASQEYANVFDRDFGVWNTKNQIAQSTWNDNWQHARSAFDAEQQASESAYQRAWQQYVDAKDTWYRNQNEPYTKLFQAASLGASAAR